MATDDVPPYDPTASRGRPRWFGLPNKDDVPPDVREEMELARQDPGPSWREWFFFHAAKWWLGLAFLIVDVWILVAALTVPLAICLGLLALAVYLEILTWQFLWHRPEGVSVRPPPVNRMWWIRPRPIGRWTPEAAEARLRGPVGGVTENAPDPREFL
jgi:hypothetical protein